MLINIWRQFLHRITFSLVQRRRRHPTRSRRNGVANQIEAIEARMMLTSVADLQVTSATVAYASGASAATVGDGDTIQVTYTVNNTGNFATVGGWNDNFYLSSKSTFDSSAVLLGSNPGWQSIYGSNGQLPLGSGQSYTATTSLTLRNTSFIGAANLLVVANGSQTISESNTSNNLLAKAVTLQAPKVDLAVSQQAVAGSTLISGNGSSVEVSWTVTNSGTDPAKGGWHDSIYLSSKSTLDNTAILLSSYTTHPPSLGAGVSYQAKTNVVIPNVSFTGAANLLIVTDDGTTQADSSVVNNIAVIPVTLASPGNIDLQVPSASVASPANPGVSITTAKPGDTINATFTVKNAGTSTAGATWQDGIYASPTQTFDRATAVYLGSFPMFAPLNAGVSYQVTHSITLPPAAAGLGFLVFVTNDGQTQRESVSTNDSFSLPLAIAASNVLLAVSNTNVSNSSGAVTTASSGDGLTVSWKVTNSGTSSASATWTDAVYLSPTQTFDYKTAVLLATPSSKSTLTGGVSYTQTATINLPFAAPGSYFLIVRANAYQGGFELNGGNNSSDFQSIPLQVSLKNVDLTVSSSSPPSTLVLGAATAVSWTVKNQGTDATNATSWTDQVYLSSTSQFDPATATLLGSVQHTGAVAAGVSYTASTTVYPSAIASGQQYLLIVADGLNNQPEADSTHKVLSIPVQVTGPNLVLTNATAPSTGQAGNGSAIAVSWTVTNSGSANTSSYWNDAVYLSDHQQFDSSAQLIPFAAGFNSFQGNLAAGKSYTVSTSLTLPNSTSGARYLLFVTNSGSVQSTTGYTSEPETSLADNVFAVPITLSRPNVNLVLKNITAPITAVNGDGQSIPISWTVQNQGTDAASAAWQDVVYLSSTPEINFSSIQLTQQSRTGAPPLAAGASYNVATNVVIPKFASGTAYLIVVANQGLAQAETNNLDSIQVLPITLTSAAASLHLTAATVPSSVAVGTAIPISWTVKNTSTDAANADWSDNVYLSTSPTSRGTLLTTVDQGSFPTGTNGSGVTPLASNAQYTVQKSVTIPPSNKPGQYYLIFTTNNTSSNQYNSGAPQSESDDTGHTFVVPVTVTAPDLIISQAVVPATVLPGQSVSVSYSVTNQSTQVANGYWTDGIYLSTQQTFDSTATLLTTLTGNNLDGGSTYTNSINATIPSGTANGTYYLLFVVNSQYSTYYAGQSESNFSNNVLAKQITVALPSLTIGTLTSPSTLAIGQAFNVSATVTNPSATATFNGGTYDYLYYSPTATFDSSTAVELSAVNGVSSLAPGASYTDQFSVSNLPSNVKAGQGYLILAVTLNSNSGGGGGGVGGAGVSSGPSNTIAIQSFAVTIAPLPDLTVTNATAPASAVIGNGGSISVSWTVKNQGAGFSNGYWNDAIYVSSKQTLDSTATRLTTVNASSVNGGALAALQSVTQTASLTLPANLPIGSQFLLFVTNDGQSLAEADSANATNNVRAVAITLSVPQVNLKITSVTASATGAPGGSIPVSWTVKNVGTATAQGNWTDSVYLSTSQTIDSSAVLLSTYPVGSNAPLAANQSYTSSQNVTLKGLYGGTLTPGQYYLVFRVNDNNQNSNYNFPYGDPINKQSETDSSDNLSVVPITIASAATGAVANLTVTQLTAPTIPVAANVPISVSWTVKNTGAIDAVGTWTDQLFFSDRSYYVGLGDSHATSLGTFTEGPLSSGMTYSVTKSVVLPNRGASQGYLLVVTQGPGSPQGSNVAAAAISITPPVADLVATGVTGVSSLVPGAQVSATLNVKNQGTGATTGSWSDAVYLSSSNFLDSSAVQLVTKNESAQGTLAAGASYSPQLSFTVPTNQTPGQYYLLFKTNDGNAMPETNYANDVIAVPLTIKGPDLVVTSITAPASVNAGDSVNLSWKVTNQGLDAATGPWTDQIYLASAPNSGVLGFFSSSRLLTTISSPGGSSVAAGGNYTASQTVMIPTDGIFGVTGNLFLIVVTNNSKSLNETDSLNDQKSVAITVTSPDLQVTAATATGPHIANGTDTVTFTVKNVGTGTATASLSDSDFVYLSNSPSYDSSAQYLVSHGAVTLPLAAGASYQQSVSVTYPAVSPGNYFLVFKTSQDFNHSFSIPVTIAAPDLVITSPTTPSAAVVGQGNVINVSFTVQNNGTTPAASGWTDGIFLSSQSTFDINTAVQLSTAFKGPVAANGSYVDTFTNVTVPNFAAGSQFLFLVVDVYQNQGVSNRSHTIKALPITLTIPAVSLSVSGVTAPATTSPGISVPVSFTVTNTGTDPANAFWQDSVYLSALPTMNASAQLLRSLSSQTPLAAGGSYQNSTTITIPTQTAAGTWYLLFVADSDHGQGLTSLTGSVVAQAIQINLANLVVSTATAPPVGTFNGTINVSWTVANIGTGTATGLLFDQVVLSNSPDLNDTSSSQSTLYSALNGNSQLAAGASYTVNQTLTLPNTVQSSGTYYLIFEAGANNFRVVPIQLAAPNADLTVTSATAPATAGSGATVTVNWTDKNIGTLAANGPWADNIYISSSQTFSLQTATLLSSVSFPAANLPLAPNASLARQANVTLPSNSSGQLYLFVVVNGNQAQSETNLSNDVSTPVSILVAQPDLKVTAVTVPVSAILGGATTVSWTVQNSSPTPAVGTWSDYVYVSQNSQFDGTATFVAAFSESSRSPLAANGSYSDSRSVVLPGTVGTGTRYIYVLTNANSTLPESNTANNVSAAKSIAVSAPDLTIGNVTTVPSIGTTAGQNVSVSWTVTNQGTVAAPAAWTDAVYLSATPTVTTGTLPLATFSETTHQGLAAGQSYTENRSVTIPAALSGHLYLIVVTNYNGGQPETNSQNNAAAKPFEVSAADPAIASGGVIAPAAGLFGTPITVQWTVKNIGTGPVLDSYNDRIYVSSKNQLDASATLLATVSAASQIPLAAGASYQKSAQVTVPITAASANGNYNIFVVTDADQQAIETNTQNDVGSTSIALTLPALPNLTASGLSLPVAGFTGQKVVVSWTDTNGGTAAATGPWVDNLYFVTDLQGHNPVLAAQVTYPGSLAIGQQSPALSQPITLPSVAGKYFLMVVTNANGGVNEGPNAINNTTIGAVPVTVTQVPLADLVVTSITPPTSVVAGATVPITYTVTNSGNAPTNAAQWLDGVFLSQSPSLTLTGNDFNDGFEILTQPIGVPAFVNNASYLAPGQSYSQTVNVPFPVSASGTWYVYVVTNRSFFHAPLDNFIDVGPVTENNPNNDLSHSTAFTVTPAPTPDLTVSPPQTPLVAFSGQPMNLSWTVTNNGPGVAIGQSLHEGFAPVVPFRPALPSESQWTDEVFLSATATLSSSSISLGKFNHNGALNSGSSYTNLQQVNLPVGLSGNFYVIVQSDINGQVFESVASPHKVGATPSAITLNLTPPPDLKTSILAVPTVALASHTLTFTYQVSNIGAGATAKADATVDWVDSFYLSPTATYNAATAILLGKQTNGTLLNAGDSYQNTISETIPDGLNGSYFLIVNADTKNSVYELDLTGKVGASTGVIAVSSKPADLVVTSVSGPATGQAGGIVPVTWTVTNQGTGDSAVTTWQDAIYADTGSTPGPNAVLVASYTHYGLLSAGGSYSQSQLMTLPISLSGAYKLFVVTNQPVLVTGQPTPPRPVFESNFANDTSVALPINITQNLANLQVTTVTAPATVQTAGTVTVNWTVQNNGTGTTNSNYWFDDIWGSTKSTLGSGGTDVYLGTVQHSNPLSAGGSYTASATVTLPANLAAAAYNFIVTTDRPVVPSNDDPLTANLVYENNETDNQKAAATTITLGPNLLVSNVTAPTTASTGQAITVGWTVTNNGVGATGNIPIDDSVYLSYDQLFSNSSIYIGTLRKTGGLAAGASYTQTTQFDLPIGLVGTFYVFVVTNTNDAVTEQNPANAMAFDSTAVQIQATPPADLVAGTVTIPANAVPGQNITINYTVTNQGVNPANGAWTDSLYLSPTPIWSVDDPLLGRVDENRNLAAGASYTGTLTALLPGVTPGSYYVIVRSNILNTIPETTLANNLKASLGSTSIDVPALTLGTPVTGTLGDQQSAFYKVTVTAGQTLQVSFSSQAANSLNELYISYGQAPSRGSADFSFGSFAPNQSLTIPTTQAGTYYILAYGSSVPTSPESYSLTASILTFAVTAAKPGTVGNAGQSTIEIDGAKFDRGTTFTLVDKNGKSYSATAATIQDAATAYVTFDLTGAVVGAYTIKAVASDGTLAQLASGLNVTAGIGGNLQTSLTGPSFALVGHLGSFNVNYGNIGSSDVGSPLIFLQSPSGTPMALTPDDVANNLSPIFLALSTKGPAGVLSPGSVASRQIYFQAPDQAHAPNNFQYVVVDANNSTPIDWTEVQQWIVPSASQSPNWSAALSRLQQSIGGTWGGFVRLLDQNASLVDPKIGDASNVGDILNVAVQKAIAAVNSSISGVLVSNSLDVQIANVTVYAENTATKKVIATTSFNDGSFVFPTVPAGSYTLSVEGAFVASGGSVTVANATPVTAVKLGITSGSQIRGTVFVAGSSQSIAGATITATNEVGGQGFLVSSDLQGNYAFAGLPPGIYDLVVDAPGHARTVIVGVDVSVANANRVVTMGAEATLTGSIGLLPGGPSQSTLQIFAQPPDNTDPKSSYSATSNLSTFSLGGLAAGTYNVTLALSGYITQTISVTVTAGQSTKIGTILLAPASEIDGSVTSNDLLNPAAGLVIQALQGTTVVGSAETDASGNFQILNLSPGIYTFSIPTVTPGLFTSPTITVQSGQTATGVAIQVQPGGVVGGMVSHLQTSVSIGGLPVFATGPGGLVLNTTTDVNGNYQFSGLLSGTYQVYLLVGGIKASKSVTVADITGATPITANLQVAYSTTLGGTVADGTGQPITDGTISLLQSGSVIATARTNSSGVYQFLVFQPGTYDLSVTSSTATFNVITGVVVSAGSAVTENFQSGTGTLNVTVTDPGQTLLGIAVGIEGLVDGALTFLSQTALAANGTASFSNLAAGNYTVVVIGQNGDTGKSTVSVPATGTASTSIALTPQATVSGKITDSGANPISGATILVKIAGNSQQGYTATSAADGTYSLVGVAPGNYDVSVFATGYQATVQTSINVTTAATVNVTLSLSTTKVTGKLVDSAGNFVPNGFVAVSDSTGHILGSSEVQSDGSFAVTSAQGVGLTLQVTVSGYAPPAIVTFNAAVGTTTALNPIVLQAIAIDPAQSSPATNKANLAWPSDGQTFADQIYQQGADLLSKLTGGVAGLEAPKCPECEPAYAAAQAAQTKYLQAIAKTISQLSQLLQQCFVVDAAYISESVIIFARVRTILALDKAWSNALSWFAAGRLAYTGIFKGINLGYDLGKALSEYNEHSKEVGTAPTEGEVEGKEGNVVADVVELLKIGTEINIFNQEQVAPAMILLRNATTGTYRMFEKEILIAKLESIAKFGAGINAVVSTLSKDPFKSTVMTAKVLDQMWKDLNNVYLPNLEKARAAYEKAKAAYEACQANADCKPKPKPNLPPPNSPKPWPIPSFPIPPLFPFDPNEIIGPSGFGDAHFVSANEVLPYTISFENKATAGLPAQQVTVTQQLDPNLDWKSFRLGSFSFGGTTYEVPANRAFYRTRIDLTHTNGYFVDVTGTIDVRSGLATWTFTTIDPATGQIPTNPSIGFLPPNTSNGIGDGSVSYTIMANPTDPTGTVINAQATVLFYTQPPIDTPKIFNTIDNGSGLIATVTTLPAYETSAGFNLSWSGNSTSAGSALAAFTIYVSDNGGTYSPFLTQTTQTTARFQGVDGHRYSFYAVASDNAGNSQSPPIAPQTTTVVDLTPPTGLLTAPNVTSTATSYTFSVNYSDNVAVNVSSLQTGNVQVTGPGGFSQLAKFVSANPNTNGSPITVLYSIVPPGGGWLASANGTYSVALLANSVKDTAGNSSAAKTLGTFTVQISQPPAITSAAQATFNVGTKGSFSVIVTGTPKPTLSETGALPNGITFNTTTGILSGTPAAATKGIYTLKFMATNGSGAPVTQTFTLTVTDTGSPVVTGTGGTRTFVKGAVPINIVPNLVVTQSTGLKIASATVTFANWQDGDLIEFSNSYALQHTFVQNLVAHTATLTITGSDTAAHYQTTLRSIVFWDVAGLPVTWLQRVATFTVTDLNSRVGVATQNLAVNTIPNSLPPTLTGTSGPKTFVKGAAPITIAPNLVVTQPNGLNIYSATVTFTNWQDGDLIEFSNSFALQHTFTQDLVGHTATLSIVGVTTAANYQTTLRSIVFWDVAGLPVTWLQRVATFTVTDISSNVGSATQNLVVNTIANSQPPTLTGTSGPETFVKGAAPIIIAPNLVVTQSNGLKIYSATVTFTNWQDGDLIEFSNSFSLQHTFTQDLVSHTATLSIVGAASAANYQTTLRSIVFWDVAGLPVTWLQRVATFTVTDISSNTGSTTQNLVVNTIANSQPPTLTGTSGPETFVKGAAPITIAPNLVVTQPNGLNIYSATVTFTNWQDGDLIEFSNSFALRHTFTQDLVGHTATLSIVGAASSANYQTTLRSIVFWDVAGLPVTWLQRVATFTVTDISSNTGSTTQNLAVNLTANSPPPAVSGVAGTVTYVKLSPPIVITPNLVITDNLNLYSVTISFTNWQDGDQLQFSNSFALQHSFTQDLVGHTALLTIIGFDSAAHYQTTLRSLVFWAAAGNLNTSTRIAKITVTDIFSKTGIGTQNIAVSN